MNPAAGQMLRRPSSLGEKAAPRPYEHSSLAWVAAQLPLVKRSTFEIIPNKKRLALSRFLFEQKALVFLALEVVARAGVYLQDVANLDE
jgi:hypothetical protein